MRRSLTALLSVASLTILALAGGAAVAAPGGSGTDRGADPSIYHTISSTVGNANLDLVDGCERTEVFVSASVGQYASQPGPVNKQGLTAVYLRVTDLCAEPDAAPTGELSAAAVGGDVLYEVQAQDGTALQVDPRLRSASVSASMTGYTGDGTEVPLVVNVTWTAAGDLEHSTVQTHERYPGVGVVSSTANELFRPATAVVDVRAGVVEASGLAPDALLEQTKSRCVEVALPGTEEFYPCFGFPG